MIVASVNIIAVIVVVIKQNVKMWRLRMRLRKYKKIQAMLVEEVMMNVSFSILAHITNN